MSTFVVNAAPVVTIGEDVDLSGIARLLDRLSGLYFDVETHGGARTMTLRLDGVDAVNLTGTTYDVETGTLTGHTVWVPLSDVARLVYL